MPRIFLFLFFVLASTHLLAQSLQVIRGTVIDKASNIPISLAHVALVNTQPILGTITDTLGNFSVPDVPTGRYDLKITCQGYEDVLVREIIVISAKQTVLTISLREIPKLLDEIMVKPNVTKDQPLNSMATVSARMLSVEEAKRYAGGFDDPARLASAFAGVAANSDVNGIIIRGNAPQYLQWKMEGIEIPNPNHFGNLEVFGGGILTGLSSQMLANSDFFTGAFPAEYNNAVSGVFDIAMRKGNTEKTERTVQLGIIGIDISQEGPFRKGGKSSYVFNYRNSTLALLEPLLPENAEKVKYQDLSFKLNFPTNRAGTLSVWGIGLADGATAKAKLDSLKWFYKDDKQQNDIKQYMGVIGLSHNYFINKTSYIKTTLAATSTASNWETQSLTNQLVLEPYSRILYKNWNYTLSTFLNKKFSSIHTNRTGVLVTQMRYHISLNKSLAENSIPSEIANSNGQSSLLSAYSSSSFSLKNGLLINVGVNGQLFTLNKQYTIEPRIGLRKWINSKQSVGIAYGLHSRLENLNFYYNNSLSTGEKAVNKNLDFTKSHHFVLSYDYNFSDLIRIKVEPYYQKLFSVPVIADSSFSLINLQNDWFFAEKLQHTGEGINYGIDLTLEKYVSKGYYYLFTTSVFNANYKGGDGIWRSTRFNRNLVVNFLIGKEWQIGTKRQNTFSLNTRFSYQGGNRYSPVREAETRLTKEVIYDETKAFSLQSAAGINMHFTAIYRRNKVKSSREIAVKILNLTGRPDFYGYKYNLQKNTIDEDLASVLIPNLSYKIEF
ncbi:TonB-dependent receptor [Spirosoma daeguense]